MKTQICTLAVLSALLLAAPQARAGNREAATVDDAADVLSELSAIPARCIPPALMQDAQGVAVIPGMIKAGFLIGGRHGRGVLCVRQADGSWSSPIFISMTGGSIGWQIGVQATDVVLVFKTRASIDRVIQGKGKFTLGADAAVAAGPIGRQMEAATDANLRAEIYSYSRSRGLFAGLALEGAALLIDDAADEAFYRVECIRPRDIVAIKGPVPPCVARLQGELLQMAGGKAQPPFAPVPLPPPPPAAVEPPLPAPRLVPAPQPLPR